MRGQRGGVVGREGRGWRGGEAVCGSGFRRGKRFGGACCGGLFVGVVFTVDEGEVRGCEEALKFGFSGVNGDVLIVDSLGFQSGDAVRIFALRSDQFTD
jgi:hypothetical protein